ncbi:uncharacterized protein LOC127874276 [Dreissena polymorpha]|uniref:Protein quiver n=1 Tax=Dreissena polymorpha TaxID=45954 RepID=A0A9D4L2P1_DREPO|nr:uncharacterized protein LOC127874276 [Dreissena polymorpha]KAH3849567.1 hypothetical protein DPMN_091970 [Dreissena polymorpha]
MENKFGCLCMLLFVSVVWQDVSANNSTGGLRCYSCFATGGHNECEDYNTFKKAMSGKGNPGVKKNCTEPFDNVCIIETFAILGATVSHIRDCSDGLKFSFTSSLQNNRSAYDRLYRLQPNNETACVWDGQNQVCLTKCNTDFCNGPVLDEVNGAFVAPAMTLVAFLSTVAVTFMLT